MTRIEISCVIFMAALTLIFEYPNCAAVSIRSTPTTITPLARVKNLVAREVWQATTRPVEVDQKTRDGQDARIVGSPTMRRIKPLQKLIGKAKVSPLYLINGTVCRYINFQPVCTTLSTTGLSVGGALGGGGGGGSGSGGGGGSGSGSGSGGGGSRPSSSGSGNGGSGGASTGGGGSSGSRPSTAGVQSDGSSVQFATPPGRISAAAMQQEPSEMYVERLDSATVPTTTASELPQASLPQTQAVMTAVRPVGLLINRRHLGLLPFRRPVHYQLLTNRREEILREKAQTRN